jgi:hypothetical protein
MGILSGLVLGLRSVQLTSCERAEEGIGVNKTTVARRRCHLIRCLIIPLTGFNVGSSDGDDVGLLKVGSNALIVK